MIISNRLKISILPIFLLISWNTFSQQYINGSLSTGGLNSSTVQAPSGFSWSELQNGNNTPGYSADAGTYILADDFTVCSNWTLSKVTFFAFVTESSPLSSSPFNKLVFAIYNGDPKLGGSSIVYGGTDVVANNYFSTSYTAGLYRILNGSTDYSRQIWKIEINLSTVLAPGTYWVAYSVGNNNSGVYTSTVPASTLIGSATQVGNNAQRKNISNGTWSALTDVGGAQDLPFIIDYSVPSCSGTPSPGSTISSVGAGPACASIPFSLSLTSPNCENGISNQWQFSTNSGTTWTNISGATLSNLRTNFSTAGVPSSATTVLFRDSLRCSNSGLIGYSTPVSITQSSFFNCYCVPGSTNCAALDDILNVTFGGINKTSTTASDCVTGGYVDYTGSVASGNVYSGISNPMSVTVNGGGTEFVGVWIDYNQNGVFESSEFNLLGTGASNSTPIVISGNINIPITALPGKTRMRVRSKFGTTLSATDVCAAYTYGQTEDYFVSITPAQNCNGVPTTGTIISTPSTVCPSTPFTLSLGNYTTLASLIGVTYQWYSSPDGVANNYSIINGATGISYSGTQATATYYKVIATCTIGGSTSTSVLLVNMNAIINCYCTPGTTNSNDNDIATNLTYSGINNSTSNSPNNGYSDYTSTVAPAVAYRTATAPISVTIPSGFSENAAIWIDYDHNGLFDASEFKFLGSTTSAGGIINNTITIPASATLGITRMRLRVRYATQLISTDVCNGYSFGETEDYLVDIRDLVGCSGAPNLGTLNSNYASLCNGENVTITSSNASTLLGSLGLSLQWYSSANGVSGWNIVNGQTTPTLTQTVSSTIYYQLVGTCVSNTTTSSAIMISLSPSTTCYCASNATASNSSDITNVTVGTLNNTSDCSSVAPGIGTNPNRYSNYTSGVGAPAAAVIYSGTTNSFSVSVGNCTTSSTANAVAIWIDLNKNGAFEDATERLYRSSVTSSTSPRTETGLLNIPATITVGGTDTIRGITRMRIVNSSQSLSTLSACGTYQYGETEDYLVDIQYAPVCSASFVPAIVSSFDTVCANIPITLSVQNSTGISALSFQWQSSADGSSWSPISGATSINLITNNNATTFYRVASLCSVSSTTNYSNVVKVVLATSGCYCAPTTTNGTVDAITNVTFGGINNTSVYTAGGFTNYSSTVPTGTGTIGGRDSIYVTVSTGSGAQEYVGVWIDYNQNGNFETTEYTSIGNNLSGGVFPNVINIPTSALPGLTRMRVRVRKTTALANTDACTIYANGETEDYQINLIACSPVTFDVSPVNTSAVCGNNIYFAVKVISVSTPTYKWQLRTSPTGSWSLVSNGANYSGATSDTLRLLNVPLSFNNYEYRAVVNGNCILADTSVSGKVSLSPTVSTSITTQPSNVSVSCGASATASFSFVVVTGSNPVYQWQTRVNATSPWSNVVNNTTFSGANLATLNLSSGITNALNGYQFRAYVSADCSFPDTTSIVTLTVNPLSLTLILTTPSTTVCNGSNVTFTATPNPNTGLISPVYKYYIANITTCNATTILGSTTIPTTNTRQLVVGMTVVITSGRGSFATGTTITSITPGVSFTVSQAPVAILANGTVIAGLLGQGSSTFTTTNIAAGNLIKCTITVNDACAVPQTATSNILTMAVTPNTNDSLTILSSATTICNGDNVTFTASAYNPGSNPTYEFMVGATSVQGPSSSNVYLNLGTITNNQAVTCKLVPSSDITCPSASPAISNAITMTVNASYPVSVSLAASPGVNVCLSTPVTFTATATNPGVSPVYVFYKNNIQVQSSSSNVYNTSSLADNDSIYCKLTSSITTCAPGNPATSNKLKVSITAQTASVIVVTTPVNACAGDSVTYTARPTNGGSLPTYQFYVNGSPVGNIDSTYKYVPASNDSIKVEMTSSLGCALPKPAIGGIRQLLFDKPTASIGFSTLTCSTNAATLDAGASPGSGTITGYLWYSGASITGPWTSTGATGATYFSGTAGNYRVAVTNSIGCTSNSTGYNLSFPISLAAMQGAYTIGAITATASGANSGTTINVSSTANLAVGAIVSVVSGTGAFAANTIITSITNSTSFVVNVTPSTNLAAGALIAGATCSNYISFKTAFTDLNARAVTASGCTFNVSAGYQENLTARLDLGSVALNASLSGRIVVFQKSGTGANPQINAYTGTGLTSASPDGMIALNGIDNITFDGINLNDANTASATTMMEYGYGLFRLSTTDGAQNNTFKNCKISLNKNNNTLGAAPMPDGSIGILSINALVGTATTAITTGGGTIGANSNNKIYNDSIINCNYGVVFTGIAATGGGTAPVDGDFGNDIGGATTATGNWILNFGGAASATVGAGGVQANNQWGMNISNNILNNNVTIAGVAGVNHPAKLVGIWGKAGTSANVTINNNSITLTSNAVNFNLEGINNTIGNTLASNTVNINNNNLALTLNPPSVSTGSLYGVYNATVATNVNMNGNTVQNCTYTSASNTGSGVFYPLYNSTAGCLNVNMNSNTVSNNSIYSNSTTTPVSYIGSANVNATPSPTVSISNNTITNNTRNVGSTATRVSMLYIANCTSGTAAVSTNNIANNNFYVTTTTTNTLTLDNIFIGADSLSNVTSNTLSNNGIYNTVNSATGVLTVYGISCTGNTVSTLSNIVNENISNNTINKLFVSTSNSSSSTGAHVIYGIFSQGGPASKGGKSIFNNQIDNLFTYSNYNGKIYGISNAYGLTVNIYKNKVSSLWPGQSATTNISFAEGIYINSNSLSTGYSTTTTLYNNMVALDYTGTPSVLGASSGVVNNSTTDALRGIDIFSTAVNSTIRLYHNTVRLAGTGVGNFNSSALYQTANGNVAYKGTLDMRNNIFVNECTPVGNGISVAYKRSSNIASPGQDSTLNNNNVFYAGASSPFRYLHYDGVAKDSTITQLKTTFGPTRDSASRSFLPVFVSNIDLHIQSCAQINTDSIESKGVQILTPVIDKDIDDETRTLATPDIGADEFTGTSFGGRVTNNISICSGSNSGVLNLVGTSGTVSVTEWQSSTDSLSWSSVSSSAGLTSYTSGNLTQTTWFRAVVLSTTCNNNSANSLPVKVTVNTSPVISLTSGGASITTADVCKGASLQLYGSGTAAFANPWGSATTGIATVSTTGLSVGVSVGGPVNITYTNTNGCSSTVQLTVNDNPIISGTNTLCVGSSTVTLTATGGSPSPSPWASSANIVATISTAGVISGVAAGSTNITYTNSGGCSSLVYPITVLAKPTITGSPSLCAGSSIMLSGSPTAAAINPWVSDNANVTINGSGFVTAGNSAGSSNITYTNSNGCASLPYSITVNAAPTVSLSAGGSSITTANVCKSSTLQLFGTATAGPSPWASSNNSIATITTGGLITPVVTGTCSITYTNNNTCTKTITFKVDTIPAGPISVTNAIRCGTGSVILSAVAPTGLLIDWFANASGGSSLSGGISFYATPSISTTTIYYAQTRNSTTGCASATPRTPVTASIGILGTWLGVTNNWSDASNWCNGVPPTSSDNVVIPSGLTTYPTITNNATCNDINIQNGASLTVSGSGKLSIYGAISSNPATVNVSDGTLEFAGGAAQTILPGLFVSSSIKNLIINNTTVNLSGALTLTGKLSFAGNNRRFVTNNNLVLKSDSATTASVGNIEKDANTNAAITGNTITGKVSVERYISGAKKAWRLLSSPTVHLAQTIKQSWMENGSANNNPVSGYGIQTTSNLPGAISLGFDTISPAGPSIKIYNSAANLWDGIATTNVNFLPGTAYMTFIRGDRSVTRYNQPSKPTRIREKDSLNMNDFTVSSLGSAGGQFASVGNPYASAISLANITRTNLDSTYYLWDPKLGAAADYGGFQTISVVNGVATVTPAGGSYNSGNKYVESGQGFFVRTTTNIGAITFKESNKVDGSYLVARPPVSSFRSFRTNILRVQNGEPNLVDGVVNVYDLSFSNNIDASDAIKFKNSMENISIISASNDLLSIDRRSGINNNDTIFFKLNQLRLSRYQFEFTPEYLDDLGLEAYLEDNYFNTKTPLSLNTTSTIDFDITNDAGSYNPDRFRIVFKVLRPVPVTFVDVKAVKQEKNVLISWRVDNEININKYVVEKSNDGVHFIAIGNKSATGSSTYTFLDEQAIDGVNYYRIRSEGLGGDINYSKVVKVIFESTPSISIYPNPVKEDRTIHLKLHKVQKGIIQIRMINHLGQKVMLKTITHNGGNQEYVISINKSIIHGYYTLEVIDGQNLKTILKLFL